MRTGWVEDQKIREISYGPLKVVTCYNGLIVNGYIFHTKDYRQHKSILNSGVCVPGNIYAEKWIRLLWYCWDIGVVISWISKQSD